MSVSLYSVQMNPSVELRRSLLRYNEPDLEKHSPSTMKQLKFGIIKPYKCKLAAYGGSTLLCWAKNGLSDKILMQVASSSRSVTSALIKDMKWPSPDDEIKFWEKEFPCKDDKKPPSDVEKDSDLMHIIHVTAEMAPIAKVGGLGDVVTGLARACLLRGHKVDIMLPFYECIPKQQIAELQLIDTFNSYHDGSGLLTTVYRGVVSGIPVIFIEPSNQFFKGKFVYGGSYNELEAYLFFSRCCLEWMQVSGTEPDIIHIHEWQTCALPLLYWDMYHQLSLKKPRLVLTIHNMEHYGECSVQQLGKCGLDGSVYATIDKAVDDRTIGHNPERLSLLKGGIVYSNSVVLPYLPTRDLVFWMACEHSNTKS